MSAPVCQVIPEDLTKFARFLDQTTGPEVAEAAHAVHQANGFDNNAFGILIAQLLAVPARIAMTEVAKNLDKVSDEIRDAGARTWKVASEFEQSDRHNSERVQRSYQDMAA